MPGSSEIPSKVEVTQLLKAWGQGDDRALERLTPVVEDELHRMAHRCMARENPGHTLQTTALVNEVYLRLIDIHAVTWQDLSLIHIFRRWLRQRLPAFGHSRSRRARQIGCNFPHPMQDTVAP